MSKSKKKQKAQREAKRQPAVSAKGKKKVKRLGR
jgi:hypothetical protein